MDLYASILSANRSSFLLNFHEDFQSITTYLLSGAIVAVIFCLAHYFYLNFLKQALETYLFTGKCLKSLFRYCV